MLNLEFTQILRYNREIDTKLRFGNLLLSETKKMHHTSPKMELLDFKNGENRAWA